MEANRRLFVLLRSSQLVISSETSGGIEASNFERLCSFVCSKVKFTDSLFGDDVTKQIKDITDDNNVTHKLLDRNRSWHRPSHANRGSGRGRAGFRGSSFRGRGSTNRPFLRQSNQYRTTTYSKPKHNQETPKN